MDTDNTAKQQVGGSRDSTFGDNGMSRLPIAAARLVTMLPDQRIVISGMEFTDYQAVRLNSDGTLDATFGNNGIAMGPYVEDRSPFASILDLQVIDHDAIVLSSAITSDGVGYLAVALLQKTGELKKTFGTNGVALINTSSDDVKVPGMPSSLGSGAFIFRHGGVDDSYLVKLTEQGVPDASFNQSGFRDIPPDAPGYAGVVAFTVQQKDNKIVYAYSKGEPGKQEFTLGRITSAGEEDLSFAEQGYLTIGPETPGENNSINLNTLITLPDDGILVIGLQSLNYFEKSVLITKLTSEGAFDKGFNQGKPLIVRREDRGIVARAGAVDQQGRIVVLGLALEAAGFSENNAFIARFLPEGVLDTTFGVGGFVVEPDGYEHNRLTIQSDGKIVVVGFQRLRDEVGEPYWQGYALRYLSD